MSKANQKGTPKNASEQANANQPLPGVSATPDTEPRQSSPETSKPQKEKPLSQRIKETPYSNDRIGQAFIMSAPFRPIKKKDSTEEKK